MPVFTAYRPSPSSWSSSRMSVSLVLRTTCAGASLVPRRGAASLECHQRDPPTARRGSASACRAAGRRPSAAAARPSARARRVLRAAPAAPRPVRAGPACAARPRSGSSASRSRRRRAATRSARCRRWAARDSGRPGSRRTPPGACGPTNTAPACRMRGTQRRGDPHQQLEVLGRQPVGELDRVRQRRRDHDRAEARERARRERAPRQRRRAARPAPPRRRAASRRSGVTQIGGRLRIVLGLRQHVGRDHRRRRRAVGDDEHLARAGDGVDVDLAVDEPLRRRDERRCRGRRSCRRAGSSPCRRPAPPPPARRRRGRARPRPATWQAARMTGGWPPGARRRDRDHLRARRRRAPAPPSSARSRDRPRGRPARRRRRDRAAG